MFFNINYMICITTLSTFDIVFCLVLSTSCLIVHNRVECVIKHVVL